MSLDKFLQIFVTKETKFFPLYIKQAEKYIMRPTPCWKWSGQMISRNKRYLEDR